FSGSAAQAQLQAQGLSRPQPMLKTIGIVVVAALAASAVAELPGVAMTATRRRTRSRLPIPEFGKGRSLPSGIQLLRFDPRCSRFRSALRGTLPADPPPFAANQNGDIRRLEWLAAARAPRAAASPPRRPSPR